MATYFYKLQIVEHILPSMAGKRGAVVRRMPRDRVMVSWFGGDTFAVAAEHLRPWQDPMLTPSPDVVAPDPSPDVVAPAADDVAQLEDEARNVRVSLQARPSDEGLQADLVRVMAELTLERRKADLRSRIAAARAEGANFMRHNLWTMSRFDLQAEALERELAALEGEGPR